MKPDFSFEIALQKDGQNLIAGVDEVGRGALAGSLVACAVIFPDYGQSIVRKLQGVTDSKALSSNKRSDLDKVVRKVAFKYAIGEVTPEEIDNFGIGAANIIAFERALDQLTGCTFALIDGRKFRGFRYPYRCLEKGELKSLSIAAASIVAKVYRDNQITEQAKQYCSCYELDKNKGYGSESHYKALLEKGPTPIHRKSFIKFIERESVPTLL